MTSSCQELPGGCGRVRQGVISGPCGDVTLLYLDSGGGYMNLHVIHKTKQYIHN